MLITAIKITDYKRVRDIEITPDADANLILLAGANAQGKSSVMHAIDAALRGAKAIAADPVRHGAEEAAIFVELDHGKLTVDRTITKDGKTRLEVRDAEGAVRKPQDLLDKLVGARFVDPLAFLQLKDAEQRAHLMRLIPDAARLDELSAKRQRAFERRTEIGRDLAKAEGELARLEEVKVEAPIDVAALNEELRQAAELQRAGDGLGHVHRAAEEAVNTAVRNHETCKGRIAELEQQLERERQALAHWETEVKGKRVAAAAAKEKLDAAAAEWTKTAARRAQLDADLARAGEHNRRVFEAEAQNKRRVQVAGDVDKLKTDRQACTEAIAKIDERKAQILAAAKLPVEGLAISDDGLELAGVPLAQASDAERWRVALALAIAASPGLHDVWIRDGALLDEESLDLVAKQAAAAGKRVWIERVGTRDPGAIVIRDGEVAG